MPYQLIAGAVVVALAFFAGWRVNEWRNDAADLKAQRVAHTAADAATKAAVDAIKGIEIKYTTIKQKAEVITRENVVYRDCQHDPDGLRILNEALTGQPATAGDQARVSGSDAPE